MALVRGQRLLQERPDSEESDDYILTSANISDTHAVDSLRPTIACSVAPPSCTALAPPLCNITSVNFQSLVRLSYRALCGTDKLHRAFAAATDAATDRGGCSNSEELSSETAGDGRVARGEKKCSAAPRGQPADVVGG